MHPTIRKLLDREYADQRSDEWLKLREGLLTASDAGTAIGVNPYEKPDNLILKKCGLIKFNGNIATAHGNKYEDEARDIYCERYNEVAHEIGLYPHPKYDWLGGSPDGITESGKLIEIKCPMGRQITDEIPIYYIAQVQLLMDILDLEECDFIEYKPSEITWPDEPVFQMIKIPRDREWFATNLPIMDAIWKRVLWHREHGCDGLKMPRIPVPRVVKRGPCSIMDAEEDVEIRQECKIQYTSDDD